MIRYGWFNGKIVDCWFEAEEEARDADWAYIGGRASLARVRSRLEALVVENSPRSYVETRATYTPRYYGLDNKRDPEHLMLHIATIDAYLAR